MIFRQCIVASSLVINYFSAELLVQLKLSRQLPCNRFPSPQWSHPLALLVAYICTNKVIVFLHFPLLFDQCDRFSIRLQSIKGSTIQTGKAL